MNKYAFAIFMFFWGAAVGAVLVAAVFIYGGVC
jgi:hypothetical protein